MAEAKTKPTAQSMADFLAGVTDEERRKDCERVAAVMQEVTGEPPVMWGSIVGFGTYNYKYASGRTGDWPLTAFSPRKKDLTIYIMPGVEEFPDLGAKLGKYSNGKSCLYVKKLSDVDMDVLRDLIARGVAHMRKLYPA